MNPNDFKLRLSRRPGWRFHLFRRPEFTVGIDPLTLLLLPLLVLTVRYRIISYYFLDLNPNAYWLVTFAISFAIIFSVLGHEAIRIAVARTRGYSMKTLFLYLFGSGDSLENSPAKKSERILVNLAGILFSIVLATTFFAESYFVENSLQAPVLSGALFHLGLFNVGLVLLQLLPVLPMDGGRLLLEFFVRQGGLKVHGVKFLYYLGYVVALSFAVLGAYLFAKDLPLTGVWLGVLAFSLANANYFEYRFFPFSQTKERLI